MLAEAFILGLDAWGLTWAVAGAICLGISKAGFPGLALVNVLILAELLGAKQSVGVVLPMLVACDVMVYPLFARYATWPAVWPILVPTLAGVSLGYFVLGAIDDATARRTIGSIILLMLALQAVRRRLPGYLDRFHDSPGFVWGCGLTMGVATMLANAAAPAYSILALGRGFTKEDFLGIGARCFLLVNLIKVPLMADLNLIHRDSLLMNLAMLPGLIGGIWTGRRLLRLIPQRVFERLLFLFSIVAGIRLLFY